MKTSTRTAAITTERGTVVNMTVTATRGFEIVNEVSFCDGDNINITRGQKTEKTETVLAINGKNYAGYFTTNMQKSDLKGCFGCFLAGNQPIGLSEAKYNELIAVVAEARKEAETDQSWIDYSERKAKADQASRQYDRHVAEMKKAMSY